MKINELEVALPVLFKANIAPLMWGEHGIGKTESVGQLAKKLGIGFMTLNLGTQEVGDLLGLPDFSGDKTTYKVPDWFPTDPNSKGILFLDEINRARRDVLQAVFSLVLEKRIHTHFLPAGWSVVAAANPYNADYVVTDISDQAFMSRFCHIKVENPMEDWANYAQSIKVPSVVVSFGLEHKNLFTSKSFELPKYDPDRRCLKRLGDIVALNELPEHLMYEVTTGILGMEAGVAYMSHTKEFQSVVKGTDVLKNWSKVKERIEGYSKDDSRIDMLNLTCNEVFTELNAMKKLSDKVLANVRSFLKTIPKDLSGSLILRLVETGEEHVHNALGNDEELVEYYKASFNFDELKAITEKRNSENKAA